MEQTKFDAFADELITLSKDPSIKVVQKKQIWTDHEGAAHAMDVILEKTASAKLKKDKGEKVDYLKDWKKINPEHSKEKKAANEKQMEAMKNMAKKLLKNHTAQGAAAGGAMGGAAGAGDEMRIRQYEKGHPEEDRKKGRLKYVAGRAAAGAVAGGTLAHSAKKAVETVHNAQRGSAWRAIDPRKKK